MSPAADGRGRHRLATLRLTSQRIAAAGPSTPADAVRWMLAMQAQDWPGARWSIGLRVPGATAASIDAACDAGEVVRTWPLRGTLHVVPAEDAAWLLALTAPRSVASVAPRRAALGIRETDVERAREVAVGSLAGGRRLTRDALLAAIGTGGVSTEGQRGYHLLWYLAQTGTVVMGPADGGRHVFVLLDEWVPRPRRPERNEALGELAHRYVRSHGPATVADLARWCGLAMADVRRGISVAGDRLTTIEVDGTTYLVTPETLDAPTPAASLHLLPGFDEYMLGYRDRSAALAPEHANAIVPGGNGMFKATIVVDGEVVGTWRRTISKREVVVEPAPFGRLSRAHLAGMARAADAYGAFLGLPARLADARPDPTGPARDGAGGRPARG